MGDAVNTIATAFAFHDNFLVANLGLTELSAHVNVSNWSCREDGDPRLPSRQACMFATVLSRLSVRHKGHEFGLCHND